MLSSALTARARTSPTAPLRPAIVKVLGMGIKMRIQGFGDNHFVNDHGFGMCNVNVGVFSSIYGWLRYQPPHVITSIFLTKSLHEHTRWSRP
jgi:hypothetical protein